MFRHFEFALLKAEYKVTVFCQLNNEWQKFAVDMRPFLVWRMSRGCIESIYRECRVGINKSRYGLVRSSQITLVGIGNVI